MIRITSRNWGKGAPLKIERLGGEGIEFRFNWRCGWVTRHSGDHEIIILWTNHQTGTSRKGHFSIWWQGTSFYLGHYIKVLKTCYKPYLNLSRRRIATNILLSARVKNIQWRVAKEGGGDWSRDLVSRTFVCLFVFFYPIHTSHILDCGILEQKRDCSQTTHILEPCL